MHLPGGYESHEVAFNSEASSALPGLRNRTHMARHHSFIVSPRAQGLVRSLRQRTQRRALAASRVNHPGVPQQARNVLGNEQSQLLLSTWLRSD
jgi:hypothetical protein